MYDARVPAEMTWNERKHVESMKGIVQIARGCVHAELKVLMASTDERINATHQRLGSIFMSYSPPMQLYTM